MKHCQFKVDGSRLSFSAVLKFALQCASMHVCEWVFLCLCVLVLLYLYFFRRKDVVVHLRQRLPAAADKWPKLM